MIITLDIQSQSRESLKCWRGSIDFILCLLVCLFFSFVMAVSHDLNHFSRYKQEGRDLVSIASKL